MTLGTPTFNLTATQITQAMNTIAAQPQAYPSNPSGLLYPYQRDLGGNGASISPEAARQQWSVNPFIPHSPNWVEWNDLEAADSRRRTSQFMKLPDVPVIRAPSKRRLSQPRLKLDFETTHDISMRLHGTVIFIGQQLYYVRDVYQQDDDYLILVDDADGKTYKTMYKACPDIDLRTPEPQYFVTENTPAFLLRGPYRQQRQGLSNETIQVKYVGEVQPRRGDVYALMRGITSENIHWAPNYYDLMVRAKAVRALRLSKDLSFYTRDDKLCAEYRGRHLGEVHDDVITVDADDGSKPWIRRDINHVGCSVRVK